MVGKMLVKMKILKKENADLRMLAIHRIVTMMIATGVILCAFFLILEFKGLGVL